MSTLSKVQNELIGKWFVHNNNIKNTSTIDYIYRIVDVYEVFGSIRDKRKQVLVKKYVYKKNRTLGNKISTMRFSYSTLMSAFTLTNKVNLGLKYKNLEEGVSL